jgi:hypothetical protein
VGATRLPARTRGPGGEQLEKHELDLSFLESPAVQREEIAGKLTRIDTGCHDPRLFWGRWTESKWGYWWVVGANTGTAGDAKRIWHVKNLLVTFDEKGALLSKQLIDDDRLLWRQLHDDIAREPAPDFPNPEVVSLTGRFHSMTLTPSGLEFVHAKAAQVLITPEKLVRFSHAGSPDKRWNVDLTCHKLYFSEKTPIGDHVDFCSSAAQVVTIFQYLNRTAPKAMQWE